MRRDGSPKLPGGALEAEAEATESREVGRGTDHAGFGVPEEGGVVGLGRVVLIGMRATGLLVHTGIAEE